MGTNGRTTGGPLSGCFATSLAIVAIIVSAITALLFS